jgi:hypothetical protein
VARGERFADDVEIAAVAAEAVDADNDARILRRAPLVIDDAMEAVGDRLVSSWRAGSVAVSVISGTIVITLFAQRAVEDEQHRRRRAECSARRGDRR